MSSLLHLLAQQDSQLIEREQEIQSYLSSHASSPLSLPVVKARPSSTPNNKPKPRTPPSSSINLQSIDSHLTGAALSRHFTLEQNNQSVRHSEPFVPSTLFRETPPTHPASLKTSLAEALQWAEKGSAPTPVEIALLARLCVAMGFTMVQPGFLSKVFDINMSIPQGSFDLLPHFQTQAQKVMGPAVECLFRPTMMPAPLFGKHIVSLCWEPDYGLGGLVELRSTTNAELTKSDCDTFEKFLQLSNEVAHSVNSIRTAKRLNLMVQQLNSDITSHDTLLRHVVEFSKQLTGANQGTVYLWEAFGNTLVSLEGDTCFMDSPNIAAYVSRTHQTVHVPNVFEWSQPDCMIPPCRATSMLCMPLVGDTHHPAVLQLGSKTGFTEWSIEAVKNFVQIAQRNLQIAEVYQAATQAQRKHKFVSAIKHAQHQQRILSVLRMLASTDIKQGLEVTMDTIMAAAQELLNADRCTVFAVDKESGQLFSKAAQGTGGQEIKLKLSEGIAGEVARTGKTLNIMDVYADERFNRNVDRMMGYVTTSLLTMPIYYRDEVVAVAQLVNKMGEDGFTVEDERLFEYFALFAGIALANARLYDIAKQSSEQAMQLLDPRSKPLTATVGPMRITREESESVRLLTPTEEEILQLKTFHFSPLKCRASGNTHMHPDKLIPLLVELFKELGVMKEFGLDEIILVNFLLTVRSYYRAVPYHNFYHAFDTAQTIFLLMQAPEVASALDMVERFTLIVTALMHDLDHMGLNNSFHLRTESPMGILCSSSGIPSVLELHHCKLAIEILSHPETNVFACLTNSQSVVAYKMMISCILATDMAKHAEISEKFAGEAAHPNWSSFDSRLLLMQMLMKAADLSNIVKPFPVARLWALAVTEEFCTQGDLEKNQHLEVQASFDRERMELAKVQTGFIDYVGSKFWGLLAGAVPGLSWAVWNLKENRQKWIEVDQQIREHIDFTE
eukprot:NODE_130_length_2998_cov_24.004528_g123_i0.p1 GENE.NODE_130_length_2998_cov_24.004528_g123_i0~~NODE_130_length_2998_cov_24.004528_g123_i0.p1  ORF type:complete len:973 (+),score=292.43 NODE_130_length_2998_cov_24.004528_g123_i0:52-2919(+)